MQVSVIDISELVAQTPKRNLVAEKIGIACRESGFFYVSHHGVDESLQEKLFALSKEFFAQDEKTKMQIAMAKGGRAWRGYFPVGNELTSGKPDIKEGIYFGSELSQDHPAVAQSIPLHGPNLFPEYPADLKQTVLTYMTAVTKLGHQLMQGLSLSLGLDENYFADRYTKDPLILFRIFNYPSPKLLGAPDASWGVGEHTDYGVLTILKQDDSGGLQVRSRGGWIEAPPLPGTFVCNIGDMLDRMTAGLYRSTPHRVRNPGGKARLSFPLFFDPNFEVKVEPLPLTNAPDISEDQQERWDKANVHAFGGTYGDYLLRKVNKVFPDLGKKVF